MSNGCAPETPAGVGPMTAEVYRSGTSLLHRLDARLKLLYLVLLIGCLFSAESALRLALLTGLWLLAALSVRERPADLLAVVRGMKWLLLATLLLHLLLTPGSTLFGTTWLSRTGLLQGVYIDIQLLLAMLFSLLLARTTRPAELAEGLTRLLSPLRRCRVPVREAGMLVHLALDFLPLIHREVRRSRTDERSLSGGFLQRLRQWASRLDGLLMRLIEQADQLAVELVRRPKALSPGETATPLVPDRRAGLTLAGGLVALLLIWQV